MNYLITTLVLIPLGVSALAGSHYTLDVRTSPSQDNGALKASSMGTRVVTGYNLLPAQTDDTPCQTALGPKVDICKLAMTEQLCAANFVPLKTRLIIGDGFECLVVDRMHPRFSERVDIVMQSVEDARLWGVQRLEVAVKR